MGLVAFFLPVLVAVGWFLASLAGGGQSGLIVQPLTMLVACVLAGVSLRRRGPWRRMAWATLVLHGGLLAVGGLLVVVFFSGALGVPKVW